MMNFIRLPAILLAFAQILPSPAAYAIRWYDMLEDTPFAKFEEDDLQLFLAASRKALNETPDNQPVRWENPATGNRGELTVLQTFASKGLPCKRVRVTNEAAGRKSTNDLQACRVDGKWKLVTASEPGN